MTFFQAKLSPDQKGIIMGSTETATALAGKFNVSTQTIYNLRSQAKEDARRREAEAKDPSRIRQGSIRDLSEWDDMTYQPQAATSRFDVPPEIVPDGIEYQWNTSEIFSQPMTQRMAGWQKQGWRPVPAERHPGRWTPIGAAGDIVVDGLMLCERPKAWCDRAREHERRAARAQIEAKKAQFKGGDIPGVSLDAQHPSALRTNTIRSEYQRITVPEE
jgi:hypothetical protein